VVRRFPASMRLGLGILDARSVWKPDPPVILPDIYVLRRSVRNVRLQPSCSLQFLPYSAQRETLLRRLGLIPMLSFALEKLDELRNLAEAAMGEETMIEEEWNWTSFQRDTSYDQVG
jgi:5-methyltetrahydropteroyltriglutamate--homocysteine methyltransferase